MGNRFASAKNSIAVCDRCGFRFKLKELKREILKTKTRSDLVCSQCFDPDQPQLQLGMYPVDDPQAIRNPRRDTTYVTAGVNTAGNLTGGSRSIQWGWAPVGGSRFFDDALTPNLLVLTGAVGQVTISTS
jgi:hypothetical protein